MGLLAFGDQVRKRLFKTFDAALIDLIEAAKGSGRKMLAVLIDPDFGTDEALLERTVQNACMAKADLIFVGGSLLTSTAFNRCVELVKQWSDRPVVLFPGSPAQLSHHADAVLFLSLISGRNPELLIGHHVTAAPTIRAMGIEAIPTGYMLVDGGKPTTVSYVSQTVPIPHDKPGIAAATAIAGELLGLRTVYMDTGSGAENWRNTRASSRPWSKNMTEPYRQITLDTLTQVARRENVR